MIERGGNPKGSAGSFLDEGEVAHENANRHRKALPTGQTMGIRQVEDAGCNELCRAMACVMAHLPYSPPDMVSPNDIASVLVPPLSPVAALLRPPDASSFRFLPVYTTLSKVPILSPPWCQDWRSVSHPNPSQAPALECPVTPP